MMMKYRFERFLTPLNILDFIKDRDFVEAENAESYSKTTEWIMNNPISARSMYYIYDNTNDSTDEVREKINNKIVVSTIEERLAKWSKEYNEKKNIKKNNCPMLYFLDSF